jgi:molybdate transport system ATP-binding protein
MLSESGIHARFRHPVAGFTLDVDLHIAGTGLTTLFGHSGAGKTTLLRCLAGLERARHGYLQVKGTIWQDNTTWLPPHQRAIGYVFQEASLFPHLSVMQNIRYSGQAACHDHLRLDTIVRLLGVQPLSDRKPHQLSGGERQRVAIARALATGPELLLMDEPLASLDHQRRQEILPFIEDIRDETGIPLIYVTHSESEAVRLSDQVIVLDNGKVRSALSPPNSSDRVNFSPEPDCGLPAWVTDT